MSFGDRAPKLKPLLIPDYVISTMVLDIKNKTGSFPKDFNEEHPFHTFYDEEKILEDHMIKECYKFCLDMYFERNGWTKSWATYKSIRGDKYWKKLIVYHAEANDKVAIIRYHDVHLYGEMEILGTLYNGIRKRVRLCDNFKSKIKDILGTYDYKSTRPSQIEKPNCLSAIKEYCLNRPSDNRGYSLLLLDTFWNYQTRRIKTCPCIDCIWKDTNG